MSTSLPFFPLNIVFSTTDQARGDEYVRSGRVRLRTCTPDLAEAQVIGSRLYSVTIERRGTAFSAECDCPRFEDVGACKHLWAVSVAARQNLLSMASGSGGRHLKALRGAHMRGAEEVPVEDQDGEDESADELDELDELGTDTHSKLEVLKARLARLLTSASARDAARRPIAPDRAPWESRLADLERLMPTEPAEAPALRMRYLLQVHGSRANSDHALALEHERLSARTGARRGRAGAPPLRDQELLDARDRSILTLLEGTVEPWAFKGGFSSRNARKIPLDLQPTLVPLLAATGSLHLQVDEAVQLEPLRDEISEPWRLAIAFDETDQAGSHLVGRLERGAERIALSHCDLVLEAGFFVSKGMLARADWQGAWRLVPALRRDEDISLPAQVTPRVLEVLARLPSGITIEAPGRVEEIHGPPIGVLRLAGTATNARASNLEGNLAFAYGDQVVRGAEAGPGLRRGDKLVRVVRDHAAEARLAGELVSAGAQRRTGAHEEHDVAVPRERLAAVCLALVDRGWRVELASGVVRSVSTPSLSVRSGIDWFDVSLDTPAEGPSPDLPELLRAVRERDPFVRLSDGTVGIVPQRWLERLTLLEGLGALGEAGVRVPRAMAWLLDAWIAEREDIALDAEFERARSGVRKGLAPEARHEPPGFQGELRPYQREGLGWLHYLAETGVGGCLADDMGLGKTVMVLALILERRARARGPTLVVAPRSVMFNWAREAERFTPGLDIVQHHGTSRAKKSTRLEDADLVVTTYGTLRRDAKLLGGIDWDCAVLDEAQAIKNAASLSAKAARVLTADLRLALTGTPIENHLGELHSIFTFLNPALVAHSRAVRELFQGRRDDVESAKLIARALRPFLLRRTKDQVLVDLPTKTEQVVLCELEGVERRAYDELRKHYRATLLGRAEEVGIESMQMNVLEALLRLRQAACHPGLIDKARVGESSAKLETLLSMLGEVVESGHKALVFSQFTSLLAIVRNRLDADKVAYEYLDGKTQDREQRVEHFQSANGPPLFLISLKAGGSGLNLTAADYVFLLDPWWNPAVEAQAVDRTHRIGQTRPVTAYRFVARDTVEEKVLELQGKKRALAEALFSSAGATLRDLTREDLDWLLG